MRSAKSKAIIHRQAQLDLCVGGQLRVLDPMGKLHCGEVSQIFIVNCILTVRLSWNAFRSGDQWCKDGDLEYSAGLPLNDLYLEKGRLRIHSLHTRVKAVLFPPAKPWRRFSKEEISLFKPPELPGYISIIAKVFNTGPAGPGDKRRFVPY